MNQKMLDTTHSVKMMWGCATLGVVVVIIALLSHAAILLFIIPCAVMIGAMMWMIMGGRGDGKQNRR